VSGFVIACVALVIVNAAVIAANVVYLVRLYRAGRWP
jgi:hypothetical protein